MLLAGDVGGTKTDLAIFSNEAGPHAPLVQSEAHSSEYSSLSALVAEFLAKTPMRVDRACFAVAGPVINGRVKTTNLPWVMDEASLAKELNLSSVHLMNDLEAIAEAIPILRAGDVCVLNAGQPVPQGAIGVIRSLLLASVTVKIEKQSRMVFVLLSRENGKTSFHSPL